MNMPRTNTKFFPLHGEREGRVMLADPDKISCITLQQKNGINVIVDGHLFDFGFDDPHDFRNARDEIFGVMAPAQETKSIATSTQDVGVEKSPAEDDVQPKEPAIHVQPKKRGTISKIIRGTFIGMMSLLAVVVILAALAMLTVATQVKQELSPSAQNQISGPSEAAIAAEMSSDLEKSGMSVGADGKLVFTPNIGHPVIESTELDCLKPQPKK